MANIKDFLSNKKLEVGYALLVIVPIFVGIYYKDKLGLLIASHNQIQEVISGFGIFGPLIFILIQVFQAVLIVIPKVAITFLGGYAFGFFWGSIYSIIGQSAGFLIYFMIARKLGRSFFDKYMPKKELRHFHVLFGKKGKKALFIARLTPMLFPQSLISFACGLTNLKIKDYFYITILGIIPYILIVNLFGDWIGNGFNPITILLASLILISEVGFFFRHKLKVWLIKEIREYEKKLESIEEKSVRDIKHIEKEIEDKFYSMENKILK